MNRRRRKPPWPRPTLGDVLELMAIWGLNPRCVRCGDDAKDPHHLKPKGRGGSDRIENKVPLCRPCHRWVHNHPDAANAAGLLIHSWEPERETRYGTEIETPTA